MKKVEIYFISHRLSCFNNLFMNQFLKDVLINGVPARVMTRWWKKHWRTEESYHSLLWKNTRKENIKVYRIEFRVWSQLCVWNVLTPYNVHPKTISLINMQNKYNFSNIYFPKKNTNIHENKEDISGIFYLGPTRIDLAPMYFRSQNQYL